MGESLVGIIVRDILECCLRSSKANAELVALEKP
jgi:hypothetical protein